MQHIAIVMDGNGRWAQKRLLPRFVGHKQGVSSLRKVVTRALDHGITHLSVFAFSSENWRRPRDEVSFLMKLFVSVLKAEAEKFHKNGIRFRVIGDRSALGDDLVSLIDHVENLTAGNTRLNLIVAANYGGRWDILQAMNRFLLAHPGFAGTPGEADLTPYLSTAGMPDPDLFIRTGGEQRVSNFMLWQMAYTELYFTPTLWPDFDGAALDQAIEVYRQRERRWGGLSDGTGNDASQPLSAHPE